MKNLKVRIITSEVKIPNISRFSSLYAVSFTHRQADGSDNISKKNSWASEEEFINWSQYIDEGTETDDFIVPASAVNPQPAITQIQDYLSEIFYLDISTATEISSDFDVKNIILLSKENYDPTSSTFQGLGRKFWAFKRWVWRQRRGPLNYSGSLIPVGGGQANKRHGLAWIFSENLFDSLYTPGVVHELGHLYGLDHWGDERHPESWKKSDTSYYQINPYWGAIMGLPLGNPTIQWSNGNYLPIWPKGRGQDDIDVISNYADFKKPPLNKNAQSLFFNNVRERKKDKKMARIFKDTSNPQTGLIGFPYDYDIIKIFVPAGGSSISIKPVNNKNRSADFDFDILYCDCELDKKKSQITMDNKFEEFWTPEGENKIVRKIAINNDDKYVARSGHDDESNSSLTLSINTEYDSLLYVRVRGDYKNPVDKDEEKPTQNDKGQDRYGSLGRYKIEAITIGDAFHDDIPNAHCERFNICIDGQTKEMTLFVQDEKDEQINGNELGINILELPCIINGETKTKRFLVIGPSLPLDSPETPGRFYLKVSKDGQCVKQAFVVGIHSES